LDSLSVIDRKQSVGISRDFWQNTSLLPSAKTYVQQNRIVDMTDTKVDLMKVALYAFLYVNLIDLDIISFKLNSNSIGFHRR